MVTEPTEKPMSHQLTPLSKPALHFNSGNVFPIHLIILTTEDSLNWSQVSVMKYSPTMPEDFSSR